jgi:hypothetical protein
MHAHDDTTLLRADDIARIAKRNGRRRTMRVSTPRLLHTLHHALLVSENAVDLAAALTPDAYERFAPHEEDPGEGRSLDVRHRVLTAANHLATREVRDPELWGTCCFDFITERIVRRLNLGFRCLTKEIDAFIREEQALVRT